LDVGGPGGGETVDPGAGVVAAVLLGEGGFLGSWAGDGGYFGHG